MWLNIMFDLPTTDSEARADYRHFHDFLLNEGYLRLQLSVYGRHCASEENGAVHMQRLRAALPPDRAAAEFEEDSRFLDHNGVDLRGVHGERRAEAAA